MNNKKAALILGLILLGNMLFGPLAQSECLNSAVAQAKDTGRQTDNRQTEIDRQIIVRLRDGEAETIAAQVGAQVIKKGPLNFATLALPAGANPDEIIRQLLNKEEVLSAERNRLKKIASLNTEKADSSVEVDDPMFSQEYNLNIARVPQAWASGAAGQGITIAIVDTGVDLNHPDLRENLLPGYNAIIESTAPGTAQDDNGHGTHVAGIAAAQLNDRGIVGVAYQAKIMPVKAMDEYGEGADDVIAAGIVWAVNHGAKIINLSLGSDTETAVLRSAVEYAQENGVLVVAAAGNFDPLKQSNPGINYPASYPRVLAVTATDAYDKIANISATGPECVLAAPGMNIISDYWSKEEGSTYAAADGTSMASSFVVGVAALIWSRYPDWTAEQVKAALEKGAEDLGRPGRDEEYGFGRVNADLSLHLSDALKSLASPAEVSVLGASVRGTMDGGPDLLVPARAFSQTMTVEVNQAESPQKLPEGVVAGGTAFAVKFTGTPQKILTLAVEAQMPAAGSDFLGYIYHWSGTRWIRIGGGVAFREVRIGIYEAGIYQVGYSLIPAATRIAGANRRETAIKIAQAAYPAGTDTVFLSREDDFPDALAAVPLAHKEQAPILLTASQNLSPEVLAEIERLAPKDVILLGGTAAISELIENQLGAQGYQVKRFGGPNRYATAAALAEALGTTGKAVVVNGDNFPDALAIASQAAQQGVPILLTADQVLAPETDLVLRQLSVAETLVIGGETRVSDSVCQRLAGVQRLAGSDRYETAAEVLALNPVAGSLVYLATGEDFPDALTGGLLAALQSTAIIMISPTGPTASYSEIMQVWHDIKAVALGGQDAISDKVLNAIQIIIR
ncbi:MAG TPA: S8 family serine peptidase [Desulfitobacteriaceae bacterium]|nr:S8 family serine peptidase [Desulfitobacteriaceae bacterium]